MTNKDAVIAKVSIIKNCLKRIRDVTSLEPESIEDFDKQDIFILNLQRAIEAASSIASKVISDKKYRVPNSYKMSFDVLRENDWIDSVACEKMQKMVGFRNIAVHDYQTLDSNILKAILTQNLSDFEDFYKQILTKQDG